MSKKLVDVRVRHYITYLSPLSIGGDHRTVPIGERDPYKILSVPSWCYGFSFFDKTDAQVGDEILIGKARNRSPTYFAGGELLDLNSLRDGVEKNESYGTILANVESAGGVGAVRTRFGTMEVFEDGDELLTTPMKFTKRLESRH